MHELSVCQALVDQVVSLAHEHHASSVERIDLQIGPLSGIEPALLLQAFPIASAGSLAHDAQLIIEEQDVRVYCEECDRESDAKVNQLVCRYCGDWRTRIVSGDEMLLVSVEMNKSEEVSYV
ncbi:MAG TPA: hydrogenase maturation nickel metallochaperone HypA [Chromatiales bacterium]|nr:hydrogenase maturation nickel metallochaperone HypA [Thiotrichales bacterium]HIP67288.1 hydrogenase maturation nickel metallochaperone HypA [Chromatiales bacterium]